ncbi:hypothetical protein BDN67DRAFT_580293 [Paxillus ammoniavirescens]|nr:hypothetical protein BDN67DRAFT_580293 [Paxillus ammoniavirescens]
MVRPASRPRTSHIFSTWPCRRPNPELNFLVSPCPRKKMIRFLQSSQFSSQTNTPGDHVFHVVCSPTSTHQFEPVVVVNDPDVSEEVVTNEEEGFTSWHVRRAACFVHGVDFKHRMQSHPSVAYLTIPYPGHT